MSTVVVHKVDQRSNAGIGSWSSTTADAVYNRDHQLYLLVGQNLSGQTPWGLYNEIKIKFV